MNRSTWTDHAWELLHEASQPPALHMALDEVLLDEVVAGRRQPCLRIWEWASSAVVIGRCQADPERVVVVRPGVDLELFHPEALSPRAASLRSSPTAHGAYPHPVVPETAEGATPDGARPG